MGRGLSASRPGRRVGHAQRTLTGVDEVRDDLTWASPPRASRHRVQRGRAREPRRRAHRRVSTRGHEPMIARTGRYPTQDARLPLHAASPPWRLATTIGGRSARPGRRAADDGCRAVLRQQAAAEIEPRDIRAYAAHVAARGVAREAVQLALAPLKALLATALEDGAIRSNPAAGLRNLFPADERERQRRSRP